MVQVNTALLCDFAETRDHLLFMVAAGITRVVRTEYPAPLGVCLALLLELHRSERDRPHELVINLINADGVSIAKVQAGFQASAGPDTDVHEPSFLPVALDLRNVGLPAQGWYSAEININGEHKRTLSFRVGPRPEAPPALPPASG